MAKFGPVLGAGCSALAILCATAGSTAAGGTEGSHTITARWPSRPFAQIGYLRPLDVGSAHVRSVTAVFPDGTRLESGHPDTIVACAHTGASYASLGWVRQGTGLWVILVLETGQCSPGPSVAGKRVTVRLLVATG
jgi:hypothetical protein